MAAASQRLLQLLLALGPELLVIDLKLLAPGLGRSQPVTAANPY